MTIGSTPVRELPAVVRRALADVVKGEEVMVRPLRRVTVVGEILKPGVLFLDPASALRDAVASAGAFTQVADGRRITLVRQGIARPIGDWQVAAAASEPIASGDVLAVPREGWLRRNILNVSSSLLVVVTSIVALSR